MRHMMVFAAVADLGLMAGTAALANREPPMPEAEAEAQGINPDYIAAQKAIDAGDYEKANSLLEKVVAAEPENSEAWSLMGYSHREMQNFDEAFRYYEKALEIDPDNRNAHEYIGEAYLEVDQPAKAEEHLDKLGLICILGCDQFDKLEEAVKMYRQNHTS